MKEAMRQDGDERECGGQFHVAVTATLVLLAKAMGRDGGERLMLNLQCIECRKVRFARGRSGDLTLGRSNVVVVMSNRTSCVNFAQNRGQASKGAAVAGRGRTPRAQSRCPD